MIIQQLDLKILALAAFGGFNVARKKWSLWSKEEADVKKQFAQKMFYTLMASSWTCEPKSLLWQSCLVRRKSQILLTKKFPWDFFLFRSTQLSFKSVSVESFWSKTILLGTHVGFFKPPTYSTTLTICRRGKDYTVCGIKSWTQLWTLITFDRMRLL